MAKGGMPDPIRELSARIQADRIDPKRPGLPLPEEEELAETYGVDRHDVRKALSHLAKRKLIARRAKGGYAVSSVKLYRKDLAPGREIGISFATPQAAFVDRTHFGLIDGIYTALHLAEMNLLMPTVDWRWLGDAPPARYFPSEHVAGVLLIDRHAPAILESLKSLQVPMVAVDHDATAHGIDSYEYENHQAGGFVARHLRQLGHRRVITVFESTDKPLETRDPAWEDRRKGFVEEWGDADGSLYMIEVQSRGIFEEALGEIGKLLHKPAAERPTAVVVPGSQLLDPITQVAAHEGLKVPEDVTVTGFGNFMDENKMTAIRFDGKELGYKSAQGLLNVVCGLRPPSAKPEHILFRGHFMPGETHARIRQTGIVS